MHMGYLKSGFRKVGKVAGYLADNYWDAGLTGGCGAWTAYLMDICNPDTLPVDAPIPMNAAGFVSIISLITSVTSESQYIHLKQLRNIGAFATGFIFSEEPVLRMTGAFYGGITILAESYRVARKHGLLEKEDVILKDLTDGEIENNKL